MNVLKKNKRVADIEKEVISRNGFDKIGTFSNKEVYLLLLDEMNRKIDKHLVFCDEMVARYIPEFNKQCEILSQVCKDMPNKGFCGKVDKMYDALYPEGEMPLHDKVGTLWYDRKILKWLLATSVGAMIMGSVTLIIGFIKGVF